MKLSQKTEYALHALIYLAHEDEVILADKISDKLKVSNSYLAKVMQELSGAGLVEAFVGPGGGYTLAKSAEAITVADVVRIFDRNLPCLSCKYEARGCTLYPDCKILTVFAGGFEQMLEKLDETSIADLVGPIMKGEKE